MIKIGTNSRLKFDQRKIILYIKRAKDFNILFFIGIIIIIQVSFQYIHEGSFILRNSFHILLCIPILLIIYFYTKELTEESIIDLAQKSFIRKKKLLGITFKTVTHSWIEPYLFKYEVDTIPIKRSQLSG